jgi:hypothetical protein
MPQYLHTDQAGRQRGHQVQQLGARNARAHQYRLSRNIHRVDRNDVLGKIDSDSDNSQGLPLSNELMRPSHFPSWHFIAVRRNTRLVRDGEVPFIR